MSNDDNNKNPYRRISDVENSLLECKTEMGQELEKGNVRMGKMANQIKMVSENQEELMTKIDTLISIFDAGEKFFKVIGWIGKGIKWTALVGGSLAAIIYFIKTGSWHK